jgi:nitrogen PTS system EIIA component
MMKNSFDFLAPGAVVAQSHCANSKALFQLIGGIAGKEYGLDPQQVVERLVERERLGTTGFGNGIAIPHAKFAALGHVTGVFVQLETPVDFAAVDGLPIDLAFCLLSPADSGALHLKALAQISRWMRDRSFVAKLRGATTSEALYALFAGIETRDAA